HSIIQPRRRPNGSRQSNGQNSSHFSPNLKSPARANEVRTSIGRLIGLKANRHAEGTTMTLFAPSTFADIALSEVDAADSIATKPIAKGQVADRERVLSLHTVSATKVPLLLGAA